MSKGGRHWSDRVLVLLVAAVVAGNAFWLQTQRRTGLVDVDEAWYLGLAFGATSSGHSVLAAPYLLWREPSFQAPLLPAMTLPLHYLLGRTVPVSYLAVLAFLALTVIATYLLGRRFTTPWWALLAATVVATLPGITDYSRHYHFALAATATFTGCVLALVSSRRFTHRPWSLAFGVGLGLVVLSRTIMLAFAPGLVLAALLAVSRHPRGERGPAVRNLAVALGVGAVIAGSWYVFSFRSVWDYLTGWGYGAESQYYGAASVASARFWLSDLAAVVSEGFYLPLAILLGAGAVLGWVSGPDRPHRWRRLLASDALLVAIPLAMGFAALVSSRNDGSGFVLPLLPATVVLSVSLLARARPRIAVQVVATALLVTCALNVVMKAELAPALDDVSIEAAPWADLRVLDRSSVIDRYVERFAGRTDDEHAQAWMDGADEVLRLSADHAVEGDEDLVTTVDGPLLNAPLLGLLAEQDGRADTTVASADRSTLEAGVPDDPVALAAAFRDLRAEGFEQLLTGPGDLSWEGFGLREGVATTAARAAGFRPAGAVTLPGDRIVTLWVADDPSPET